MSNRLPRSAPASPFEGPLFIVGLPRSGTKLIRDLANRHPRIAIPLVETEFLPYLVAHSRRWGDLRERRRFADFHRELRALPYFRLMERAGWGVETDAWYESCPDHSIAGAFEALLRLQLAAPRGSGIVWGDKSPSYVRHTGLLARLFPDARFVHIVRDGRDQALSAHRAWGTSLTRAAQRWSDGVRALAEDAASLGDALLVVRYEDLLERPEREMRRVAELVGVEYAPDMTTLARSMEREGDAGGWTEIKRDNAGKHVHGLTPRVRARLDRIAAAELRSYGYPVAPHLRVRRVPRAWLLLLQGVDGLRFLAISARDVGWRRAPRYWWKRYLTSGNRIARG